MRDLAALPAYVEPLPYAQDGNQPVAAAGPDLVVDDLVGLGVVLAPLAVPDHHVGAAELGEHGAGDVAGVGAGVMRGEVLRTVGDPQPVTVDQRLDTADVGERRQDRDLSGLVVGVAQRVGQLLHERDGLAVVEVHLPVTRHQRRGPGYVRSIRTAGPRSALPSGSSRPGAPPAGARPGRPP